MTDNANKYDANDQEKEILVSEMPKYFSYPRRSTERQRLCEEVFQRLRALSDRGANHWTETKVRQWWTNNRAKYGCAENERPARPKPKPLPPEPTPPAPPPAPPDPVPKPQSWTSGRDLAPITRDGLSGIPSSLEPLFGTPSSLDSNPFAGLSGMRGSSMPSRQQSTGDNIWSAGPSRNTSDAFGFRMLTDNLLSATPSNMFSVLSRGSSSVDIADGGGEGPTWAGQSSQGSERNPSAVQRGPDDDVTKAKDLYRRIKMLTDVRHEEREPKARELENDFREFVREFRRKNQKGPEEHDVATRVSAERTRGAKLSGARVECSDKVGCAVGTTRGMVYTRPGDNSEIELCCGEIRAKTGFSRPPQGIFFSKELERVFIAGESVVRCFKVDTLECVGTFDASGALTKEAPAALTVFYERLSGRHLLLLACEAVLLSWTLDGCSDEIQKPSAKTDELEIPKITSICAVGDFVAIASSNYEVIHVYHMSEQDRVLTLYERLIGHSDSITCLKAVDGTRLLSGSFDGTVRLWDVTHARTEVFYCGHSGRISAIDYGRNGTEFMVTAGTDGNICLWNLSSKSAMIKIYVNGYGSMDKFYATALALDPEAKTVTMVVACGSDSSNTQLHICQLEMGARPPAAAVC